MGTTTVTNILLIVIAAELFVTWLGVSASLGPPSPAPNRVSVTRGPGLTSLARSIAARTLLREHPGLASPGPTT